LPLRRTCRLAPPWPGYPANPGNASIRRSVGRITAAGPPRILQTALRGEL